jgi:hypothetical protein
MGFAKKICLLVVSPQDGWKEISKEIVPVQALLRGVMFPMLAVLAITPFANMLYRPEVTSLSFTIQSAIVEFVKYFFGYFLSSYFLGGLFPQLNKSKSSQNKMNVFIAYNMIILILINIVRNLLPTPLPMVDILQFYVIFVIYKGKDFLGIEENGTKFVVLASVFIILAPFAIGQIFSAILPKPIS